MQMSVALAKLRRLGDIYLCSDGRITGTYESTTIELTSFCNLSCPLCPVARDANTMDRERKMITREDFEKIVRLSGKISQSFVMSMWGEPLLHKEFGALLDIALAEGKPIWISTNLNYSARLAVRLAEHPLLHVICSLDGWDEESYKSYRLGGRWDRVNENLAILAKGKCNVYPQFLINSDNQKHVEIMRAYCDGHELRRENILLNEMIENFRNEDVGTVPGNCHAPYRGLHFNSDGYLLPCAVNIGKDLRLPHITELDSTEDLLNGAAIREMRINLKRDKNQYESCHSCDGVRYEKVVFGSAKARLRNMFSGTP